MDDALSILLRRTFLVALVLLNGVLVAEDLSIAVQLRSAV
jgi:hypothetical protein